MAQHEFLPPEFVDPALSPAVRAGIVDLFAADDGREYGVVPLVGRDFKQHVLGEVNLTDIVVFAAERAGVDVGLQVGSASINGTPGEELAQLSYDLLHPFSREFSIDLVKTFDTTVQAGYRSLGAIAFSEDKQRNVRFGALFVPQVYKFGIYDSLDLEDPLNAGLADDTREQASTSIAVGVLEWALTTTYPSII